MHEDNADKHARVNAQNKVEQTQSTGAGCTEQHRAAQSSTEQHSTGISLPTRTTPCASQTVLPQRPGRFGTWLPTLQRSPVANVTKHHAAAVEEGLGAATGTHTRHNARRVSSSPHHSTPTPQEQHLLHTSTHNTPLHLRECYSTFEPLFTFSSFMA